MQFRRLSSHYGGLPPCPERPVRQVHSDQLGVPPPSDPDRRPGSCGTGSGPPTCPPELTERRVNEHLRAPGIAWSAPDITRSADGSPSVPVTRAAVGRSRRPKLPVCREDGSLNCQHQTADDSRYLRPVHCLDPGGDSASRDCEPFLSCILPAQGHNRAPANGRGAV